MPETNATARSVCPCCNARYDATEGRHLVGGYGTRTMYVPDCACEPAECPGCDQVHDAKGLRPGAYCAECEAIAASDDHAAHPDACRCADCQACRVEHTAYLRRSA